MLPRYFFLILFSAMVINSPAQESMLPGIDYSFLDKLIAAAKVNYPKMRATKDKLKIAEYSIQKAKLDWFNVVSFTYLYSPNNSTTALVNPSLLNGYQFGFSTTIGGFLQKPVAVRSARMEYDIAKSNLDEYNMNLEAMVKQRYFIYVQQTAILNWRIKSLEGAESSLKEEKYKFEKGLEPFDIYNSALSTYSASVQFKIESEGAFLVAKTNLEEIVGVKLESIK